MRVLGGAAKRSALWLVRVSSFWFGEGFWCRFWWWEVGFGVLGSVLFDPLDSSDGSSSVASVFEEIFGDSLILLSSSTVDVSLELSRRRLDDVDEACPKLSRVCFDIVNVITVDEQR